MDPLSIVGLPALMAVTPGTADVVIGLLDGPVRLDHPDLASARVRSLPGAPAACGDATGAACRHGTVVARILVGAAGAGGPGVAPGCTVLVRPIFTEPTPPGRAPSADPAEVARAVVECVDAGARVLNLSAALVGGDPGSARLVEQAMRYAAQRGALIVTAAGNQGAVRGTVLTQRPGTIPVVAYALDGRPLEASNLGRSIGQGLGAAGEGVPGDPGAGSAPRGSSVAAPFVTGAIALLWSAFPDASATEITYALLRSAATRRRVVPPLMRAGAAYEMLSRERARSTAS